MDLLFWVGEAYLAVLRLQRDVEVAQSEWDSLQAHTANIKLLRSQDRVADSDVLAADVAVTSAWQRRLHQGRALEVARGQYNRLLGRPVTDAVELAEVQFEPLSGSFEQLLQIAIDRRPDLRALMANAEANDFTAISLRGTARPQVTASVGARYDENRFATPQALATAAIVVDWNLYNGGRANRLADAEAARAASARCLAEDLKAQIAVDLLSARNALVEADEQGAVANQMIAHTAENLRVTRLLFDQGMALNAAVLKAQTQWTQAQRDRYHAHYQGAAAQLRIRYLTGMLSELGPHRLPAIGNAAGSSPN